jgi:hypothetical protein
VSIFRKLFVSLSPPALLHFRPPFVIFIVQTARNSQISCIFAPAIILHSIMTNANAMLLHTLTSLRDTAHRPTLTGRTTEAVGGIGRAKITPPYKP